MSTRKDAEAPCGTPITYKLREKKMKKLAAEITFMLILFYCSTAFSQPHSIKIIELNTEKEYVLIKNEGKQPVDLKGWLLHDHDYGKEEVYSYAFQDIQLKRGQVLQMQSGITKKKGKEDERTYKLSGVAYYIRWSDRNVWNNECDIAYLLDRNGKLIAESHKGTELTRKKKASCR